MSIAEQLHAILDPLLGANMTESAIILDCKKIGRLPETLVAADMKGLSELLVKGLVLFVGTEKAQEIGERIRAIR